MNFEISYKEDENYFDYLGSGIWVMDNHKWALLVWDKYSSAKPTKLIHIDYHWDSNYDYEIGSREEKELINCSTDKLESIIKEGKHIQYDSFIAPAIARSVTSSIEFLCYQDEEKGVDTKLLDKFGATQSFHDRSKSLATIDIEKPLIFDFCVDVFNKSDKYKNKKGKP